MGAFDTAAFVFSNRGMQMEQIAVISVLGSLYGAVTVALAAIFLARTHFTLAIGGYRDDFCGDLSDQPIVFCFLADTSHVFRFSAVFPLLIHYTAR